MWPLGEEDQRKLLRLAREALEEAVRQGALSEIAPPGGRLGEPCGAFVTLKKRGRLRGCIGYVEPCKPLFQTVRECAVSAALHDPRFDPVSPEELSQLGIEISVLSLIVDTPPGQVEIGRHGLLISQGPLRGLLLPQVAVEWKWDRERFLEETCLKAGLDADAWKQGARVQTFVAQVFGEDSDERRSSHHAA